jgi:hypothetical protein
MVGATGVLGARRMHVRARGGDQFRVQYDPGCVKTRRIDRA